LVGKYIAIINLINPLPKKLIYATYTTTFIREFKKHDIPVIKYKFGEIQSEIINYIK
jgi:hypothetical protein